MPRSDLKNANRILSNARKTGAGLSAPSQEQRSRPSVSGYAPFALAGLIASLFLVSAGCAQRATVATVPAPTPGPAVEGEQLTGPSATIVSKYLEATQSHEDSLRGASMEVNISADVPKLQEHGTLRALRKISKVGQITYHVLGFQGSNTVKNQVIARYLQAEQQGQGDQSLAIAPANYKFKFKGEKPEHGARVYVFQLTPHKKKVGLFKGEMWLDTKTYLPVFERGKFVRNPSIFFKAVEFERSFAIQNGIAVPQSVTSTIDVRLIGKVALSINFSKFMQNSDTAQADDGTDSASLPSPQAKE